jgi:hypothetical protein
MIKIPPELFVLFQFLPRRHESKLPGHFAGVPLWVEAVAFQHLVYVLKQCFHKQQARLYDSTWVALLVKMFRTTWSGGGYPEMRTCMHIGYYV